MNIHDSDARLIFAALDSSGNGEVSYQEFCELSEERRLKIDPFDREPKNQSHFLASIIKRSDNSLDKGSIY